MKLLVWISCQGVCARCIHGSMHELLHPWRSTPTIEPRGGPRPRRRRAVELTVVRGSMWRRRAGRGRAHLWSRRARCVRLLLLLLGKNIAPGLVLPPLFTVGSRPQHTRARPGRACEERGRIRDDSSASHSDRRRRRFAGTAARAEALRQRMLLCCMHGKKR